MNCFWQLILNEKTEKCRDCNKILTTFLIWRKNLFLINILFLIFRLLFHRKSIGQDVAIPGRDPSPNLLDDLLRLPANGILTQKVNGKARVISTSPHKRNGNFPLYLLHPLRSSIGHHVLSVWKQRELVEYT